MKQLQTKTGRMNQWLAFMPCVLAIDYGFVLAGVCTRPQQKNAVAIVLDSSVALGVIQQRICACVGWIKPTFRKNILLIMVAAVGF